MISEKFSAEARAMARIWPTHSPWDTADGLRNRSLPREKPVTQDRVTGFDLRK